MNGTTNQIEKALAIIEEHNEVVSGNAKAQMIVSEFNLDWDNADAQKIIDMSGWAKRSQDLGFGQTAKAKFNKFKFYNMIGVVFGISA